MLQLSLVLLLAEFARAAMIAPQGATGDDLTTGRQVSIEWKQAEKATVVVFLSAKCPCSNSHEPAIEALEKEFSGAGFRFVAVNSNADEDDSLAKAHFSNRFSFPIIRDSEARIADHFGALKTPHAFVVSPSREILFDGGVDNSADAARASQFFLRNALAAIRDGKKPDPKTARALGCRIKRP